MRRSAPHPLTCLTLALLLPLLSGCGEDSTTDPGPPEDPPTSTSGTVGPSGGTLTSEDGKLEVVIPPGALAASTEITVTEVTAADVAATFGGYVGGTALALEPAGLALAIPIEITFETELGFGPTTAPRGGDFEVHRRPEIQLAFGRVGDRSVLPDQQIWYDVSRGDVKFWVEAESFQPFTFGTIFPDENGESDDDRSFFDWFVTAPGHDPFAGTPMPTQIRLQLAGEEYGLLRDFVFRVPVGVGFGANIPNGTVVKPNTTTDGRGFDTHEFDVEYETPSFGPTKLGFELGYQYELADPEMLDVPELDLEDLGDVQKWVLLDDIELNVLPCGAPPCAPQLPSVLFDTGMTALAGISTTYQPIGEDPPFPTNGPWLFVAGYQGVQYWDLDIPPGGGLSTPIDKVGEVLSLDCWGSAQAIGYNDSDVARVMFLFGGAGGYRTHWNDAKGEYGSVLLMTGSPVLDAVSYANNSGHNGVSYCNGITVRFLEHDPSVGLFSQPASSTLHPFVFPESNGGPRSALVHFATQQVLVVMDGSPRRSGTTTA